MRRVGDGLKELQDRLAKTLFGRTMTEAKEKKVCIMCERPAEGLSDIDAREYEISGLCPRCFEECTRGEMEANLGCTDVSETRSWHRVETSYKP